MTEHGRIAGLKRTHQLGVAIGRSARGRHLVDPEQVDVPLVHLHGLGVIRDDRSLCIDERPPPATKKANH